MNVSFKDGNATLDAFEYTELYASIAIKNGKTGEDSIAISVLLDKEEAAALGEALVNWSRK